MQGINAEPLTFLKTRKVDTTTDIKTEKNRRYGLKKTEIIDVFIVFCSNPMPIS